MPMKGIFYKEYFIVKLNNFFNHLDISTKECPSKLSAYQMEVKVVRIAGLY